MARGGLQILLGSLGIELDPKQIETDIKNMIGNVNATAAFIRSVDARLTRIEQHLGIEIPVSLPATTEENAANEQRKQA